MIKKVVVLPDVHLDYYYPKPYLPVRKFITKFKPDEIILLGDFMNMSSFNRHEMDNLLYRENKRYKKEIDFVNKELDFLSLHTKKITYLGANHEDWNAKYLKKHPELEGLIEFQNLLKFKERNITYLEYNVPYKLGTYNFIHGTYTNEHHAKKTVLKMGGNTVYGHIHEVQMFLLATYLQQPILGISLGCLCEKEQDYLRGMFPNWSNGFGIFYYNTKTNLSNLYPVTIIDNKFIWDGVEYK